MPPMPEKEPLLDVPHHTVVERCAIAQFSGSVVATLFHEIAVARDVGFVGHLVDHIVVSIFRQGHEERFERHFTRGDMVGRRSLRWRGVC
jgi:hypothetical protein